MICPYCHLETAPLQYHEGKKDCERAMIERGNRTISADGQTREVESNPGLSTADETALD